MRHLFTLSIVLFIFISVVTSEGCKKDKKTTTFNCSGYICNLRGMRHWHGTNQDINWYFPPGFPSYSTDDTIHLNDTAFTINIINDTVINMFNTDIPYESTDSTKQIIYFFAQNNITIGYYQVMYFYNKDSISYSSRGGGQNTYVVTTYYTY